MKNPTGNKLEKLVFGMFDEMVEGADKYVTKQGSTWLIFTEDKRWVVEFTKDKTLWFNYNMFQSELELIGKDSTEEIDLIKSWFESRFLNKPKVKHTNHLTIGDSWEVEDTIQNGIRHTGCFPPERTWIVEDTIQNGIRHTYSTPTTRLIIVEDTIQNGVRRTSKRLQKPFRSVKDAIQNGVKNTFFNLNNNSKEVEDTIQNGICDVKHSYDFEEIVVKDIIEDSYPHKHRVEGVIKNRVKDGI